MSQCNNEIMYLKLLKQLNKHLTQYWLSLAQHVWLFFSLLAPTHTYSTIYYLTLYKYQLDTESILVKRSCGVSMLKSCVFFHLFFFWIIQFFIQSYELKSINLLEFSLHLRIKVLRPNHNHLSNPLCLNPTELQPKLQLNLAQLIPSLQEDI